MEVGDGQREKDEELGMIRESFRRGVMTGRSYGPQGGEGWREVGHLQEKERQREEVRKVTGRKKGQEEG